MVWTLFNQNSSFWLFVCSEVCFFCCLQSTFVSMFCLLFTINPCALETSKPYARLMFKFRCQFELVPLTTPLWNGVNLVCVSSITFNFNYCKVIGKPHFCITKIHANTTTSPSFVKTFIDSCFCDLVFQDRWFEREVNGIFLFTTINEHILLSIASMASSKVWFIHFPLLFVVATLLIHRLLRFGFDACWGGIVTFSNACWSNMLEHRL